MCENGACSSYGELGSALEPSLVQENHVIKCYLTSMGERASLGSFYEEEGEARFFPFKDVVQK